MHAQREREGWGERQGTGNQNVCVHCDSQCLLNETSCRNIGTTLAEKQTSTRKIVKDRASDRRQRMQRPGVRVWFRPTSSQRTRHVSNHIHLMDLW